MSEYMMLMKGDGGTDVEWVAYIDTLTVSGTFLGGSALGKGNRFANNGEKERCDVTGYMKFEAESIEDVIALLPGNPVFEAGGDVEVLELIGT